jgi:hypothetical protein
MHQFSKPVGAKHSMAFVSKTARLAMFARGKWGKSASWRKGNHCFLPHAEGRGRIVNNYTEIMSFAALEPSINRVISCIKLPTYYF